MADEDFEGDCTLLGHGNGGSKLSCTGNCFRGAGVITTPALALLDVTAAAVMS
jgi:hypothetical protein